MSIENLIKLLEEYKGPYLTLKIGWNLSKTLINLYIYIYIYTRRLPKDYAKKHL